MLFNAPDHKQNTFNVQVTGNFKTSKDSFYSFTENEILHITFVKRADGSIFEEVRELIFLDEIDQFFPAETPILIYQSKYRSVRGYRDFLRKQPLFDEHEHLLKKYARMIRNEPNWNFNNNVPF